MATPSLFPQDVAKVDRKRIDKVYYAMRQRCKARLWKSGPRKGKVKVPAVILPFTSEELWHHAVRYVGEGKRCPYCERIGNANFITLADCVFDHVVPRKRGGSWSLDNLCPVCAECNNTKGEMSLQTYFLVMKELRKLPAEDTTYIVKCLRTQGRVMTSFRGDQEESAKSSKPTPAEQLSAFDPDF